MLEVAQVGTGVAIRQAMDGAAALKNPDLHIDVICWTGTISELVSWLNLPATAAPRLLARCSRVGQRNLLRIAPANPRVVCAPAIRRLLNLENHE